MGGNDGTGGVATGGSEATGGVATGGMGTGGAPIEHRWIASEAADGMLLDVAEFPLPDATTATLSVVSQTWSPDGNLLAICTGGALCR